MFCRDERRTGLTAVAVDPDNRDKSTRAAAAVLGFVSRVGTFAPDQLMCDMCMS